MADKQISQLVEATSINGEDLFVMQQGGTAKKLSGQRLSNYVYSSAAEQIERVNETVAEAQEAVDELEEQKNTIAQTIADMAELGTDTTLTTPGMAADAKTVGDRIEGIEDIAEADLELLSAKPGSIVSFYNGIDDVPVKSLKLNIDPVQDLHGYDNPWPGGGGKNLLDTSSFVNGTYRGITVTVQPDGSFLCNGTATEAGGILLGSVELGAGTYAFTGITDGDTENKYYLNFSGLVNVTTAERTYTVEESAGTVCSLQVFPNYTINNLVVKPMIRLTTQSDTYEPYSNICPITGWTGANIGVAEHYLPLRPDCPEKTKDKGVSYDVTKYPFVFVNGTATGGASYSGLIGLTYQSFPLSAGQYTIKIIGEIDNTEVVVQFQSGSGLSNTSLTKDHPSTTFELTSTYGVGWYLKIDNGKTVNSKFAIVYDDGHSYHIEFPSSAGTVYGGTLDVTTGKLVVDRASVDIGTLDWVKVVQGTSIFFQTDGIKTVAKPPADNNTVANCLSSSYRFVTWNSSERATGIAAMAGKNDMAEGRLSFQNYQFASSTAGEFKNAMSGVQLVYELKAPVTYQLSPTQVRTLLGENHASADTGDITELIYRVLPDPKVVENADQLLSDTGTTEKVPYLFRKTGGDVEHAGRLTDKIVGGTIAWNQLCDSAGASSESNGITWTKNNDGSYTANGTATGDSYKDATYGINEKADHVMFICGCPANGSITTYFMYDGYVTYTFSSDVGNGRLYKKGDNYNFVCRMYVMSGTTVDNIVFRPQAFDLTQMFGSAVADQIYAMEQATAGAGVAFFKSLFPKPYYAYNAGELMSVNTSAHKTVGKNLLESTEQVMKQLNTSGTWNGNSYTVNGVTFTVLNDGIRVSGTATANITFAAAKVYAGFGDVLISGIPISGSDSTVVNAVYVQGGSAFSGRLKTIYATTDVSANFDSETRNMYYAIGIASGYSVSGLVFKPMIRFASVTDGTYEPYESHTYPLDSSLTLRGVPKLDANNKVYYDGDIYESDGKVTRRFTAVDLGTLTFNYDSPHTAFFANLPTDAKNETSINGVCQKYVPYTGTLSGTSWSTLGDGQFVLSKNLSTAGRLAVAIKDSAYTDPAIFKTVMSGVYLVYELATPTTETANPFTDLQICSPYGTEEYVDTRVVAVPVGHETFYHEDLKGKIEGLPWDLSMIAPIENGATASQAYAQGKFFIRNNQFCKAKTSIASGASFTLGTNYEVTTVAAELFSALS